MIKSFLFLLQLFALLIEMLGIYLAFIDINRMSITNKIDFWLRRNISVSKGIMFNRHDWYLLPLIAFGGTLVLIFSYEKYNDTDSFTKYIVALFSTASLSIICFFKIAFVLTERYTKNNLIASFGLVMAGIGFLISALTFLLTID